MRNGKKANQLPAAENQPRTRAAMKRASLGDVSNTRATVKRGPLGDVTNTILGNPDFPNKKTKASNVSSKYETASRSQSVKLSKTCKNIGSNTNSILQSESSTSSLYWEKSQLNSSMLSVQSPTGVDELHKEEVRDEESIESRIKHLKMKENNNKIIDYIKNTNTTLKPYMRRTLVDWLVDVVDDMDLCLETLYMGVNLMDQSLCRFTVEEPMFQLLGSSAMLLAAKFQEMKRHAPTVEDFILISDETYSKKEFVAMEKRIVDALNYEINIVTPFHFLEHFLAISKANEKQTAFVNYLSELMMVEYQFVTFCPSIKAASCVNLARQTLHQRNKEIWPSELELHTGYKSCDLEEVVRKLHAVHSEAHYLGVKAVKEKYSKPEKHAASTVMALRASQLSF